MRWFVIVAVWAACVAGLALRSAVEPAPQAFVGASPRSGGGPSAAEGDRSAPGISAAPSAPDPGDLPAGAAAGPAPIIAGPVTPAMLEAERAIELDHPRPEHPVEWAVFRSQQRFDEDGAIAHGALMTAVRQRQELIAARQGLGAGVGGLGRHAWTWLGPGNIGGRVRALVIHPDDVNRMWLGSVGGGLWKTDNGGASWTPVDDFLPVLAITALVMDPADPNILYAGTGEGAFFLTEDGTSNTAAMRGAGVFKSIDGGETWNQLPSTDGPDWVHVCRLAISPVDSRILLAATGTGIYRSTDGGQTWSRRTVARTLDVKFHPTDDMLAVAGRADNTAQYSTDGGLTWTNATGITGGSRVELAYAASDPNWVYASVSGVNGVIRVWRSTDGGRTYTLRSGNVVSTLAIYDNALWVDPTNANRVIVGGLDLCRSTDGGLSFTRISEWSIAPASAHADQHVIVQSPGFDGNLNRTVFFGNDGGIYRASDVYTVSRERGWLELNNNLGVTQFYGAAVNAQNGRIVAGAQDNGTVLFTGDPENWRSVIGGDGGFCAADPSDPNVFYGTTQRHFIRRSVNGGFSFQGITGGENDLADRGGFATNFIPHYILDPNEPNRMLAAALRLWRTNNVKDAEPDWFIIKQAIPECPVSAPPPDIRFDHFAENSPCNISTIAVAPGDSDTVWVGHNRGDIYMTSDGAQPVPNWSRVDLNEPSLPQRWVARIAIDPRDAARVTVAFMGYAPDNLWRTEDGGASWTLITGQGETRLPDAPITALLLHPAKPGWIYAGTDVGIFASEDDGLTWSAENDGPAVVAVDELVWKDECHMLAVTHGRGVFEADICGPCGDVNALAAACKRRTGAVKAKLTTDLPPGTELTLTLDGQQSRAVVIGARGKAKASFPGAGPGDHEVCLDECPGLCDSTACR